MTHRRLPPAYRFVVLILRPLLLLLTKRDWHGMQHLPKDGGWIAAPNHMSYFDPFVVALFLYDSGFPPFFLGKEAVFRIPVFGKLVKWSGQIPVYRGTGQAAGAYRAAVDAVHEGKTVVIFPEGTLTRDPRQWPMRGKTGAARLALQTGRPLRILSDDVAERTAREWEDYPGYADAHLREIKALLDAEAADYAS